MIPHTFEEWKRCIVEDCGIKLTRDFVIKRLSIYENKSNPETQNFSKLYGNQHLDNVIYWYKKTLK